MRLFLNLAYLFLSLLFLISCSTKTSATANLTSLSKTENAEDSANNIVYLFFEIEKSENGVEKVMLTDKKTTVGILKEGSVEDKENISGNIKVAFLNKEGEKISERIIEDPLNPMMEIYTQEGINKEKMNLQKAEFSIRFNQTGNIASVQLEKINKESKTPLLTIKL
jgi:hypothetical protein